MEPTAMQRGARTLTHGQRLLLRRLAARAAAWVRAGRRDDLDGLAAVLGCLLRAVLLLAGAYGAWWALRRWPAALWVLVPLWCWAAVRAIPKAEPEQPAEVPVEADDEPDPAPAPGPPMPTLTDLSDTVSRVGTPHAHLAVIAEALDTTTDQVREALTQHGIPVEPVRMRGRGSSTGVKGDHFPAPAAPSATVVAAGQPNNNNANNAFRITDDPTNPYRHHVHHASH
ncbi:hypothetical protein [Streptomyces violaceoruber]|uniref:hypothetical protein n=1 Tax=Streptomyces violaceoruber TaxID=1935 RepID=UPI003B43340C